MRGIQMRSTSLATFLFYSFLLLFGGWILLLPLSEKRQLIGLKGHHLRLFPFSVWAVQQLSPSMYNFAQRGKRMGPAQGQVRPFEWVNHYPPRLITFGPSRLDFFSSGSPVTFYFESSYRRQKLESIYQVYAQSGQLQMKLVESKDDSH